MAAATTFGNAATSSLFWRQMKRALNYRNNVRLDPLGGGLFAFDTGAVTISTDKVDDIGDEHYVLRFPDQTYLVALQVTSTEMDTGVDALVMDFQTQTSGGTEAKLITGSTIGQGGGSDELDANLGSSLLDVSNLYLGHEVTTDAATPAAGTLRYKGLVWMGAPISIA